MTDFTVDTKLKVVGVDVKGDLDAGTLKFNVDTSALKKLVRDASDAAKRVKAKFDNIKLNKIKIEINKNSLRSAESQIRSAIQNAVKKVDVNVSPSAGKGSDPFKQQRKSAGMAAANLDKLNQATKDVNRGLRSLARTLNNFTAAPPGASRAPQAPAPSLPTPRGATTMSVDQLVQGDRQAEASSDRMTSKRISNMRRLAEAGDRQAQQRVQEIDRIRKRVDQLARKEMKLQQQLMGAGGGIGGGGFRGGPPGGFGATPGGGDFDKSKGSMQKLQQAMGQLEMNTKSAGGAMRELDDLAFEVGKKAAAFRGVAIAINTIVNASQAAAKFVIDFNDSLQELNKILQFSNFGLQQIGNQLFRLSAATGVAVDQTVEIATTFARAGLAGRGYGTVVDLTENALTGLQGTTLDVTQATTIMIQVIQQVEANARGLNKELITTGKLFDVLGRAEDITASKAQDVAEAFKRSAASLFATGVEVEQATALISVLQERTQRGGEVIGTALKTLAARTSNSASEASKALESIGVATIDAQGNLRNTFEVLADTATAFQFLTEAEQANIAVKVAGVRQVEILRAALLDYNRVLEVNQELVNAEGDAARKQAVEQAKLANVIERTKIALQELVKNASEGILGQAFAGAIKGAEALVRFIADFDNKLGGALSTFTGFVAIFGAVRALLPLFKGIFKALQTFVNQAKAGEGAMKGVGDATFRVGNIADNKMNKAFMRTATVMQQLNVEISKMAIETDKAAAKAERLAQATLQARAELGAGASESAVRGRAGRIERATDPSRIAQQQRIMAIDRTVKADDTGQSLQRLVKARKDTPEVFSAAEIRKIDQLNEAYGKNFKASTRLSRSLGKLRTNLNNVLKSSLLWGTGLSVLGGVLGEASQAAYDAGENTKGAAAAFLGAGAQAAALGALIGGPWTAAIFGVVGGLGKLLSLQKSNGLTVESLQKQYQRLGIIQKEAGENAAFAGKMIEDAFKNVKKFQEFVAAGRSGDLSPDANRLQEGLRGLSGQARVDKEAELRTKFAREREEKIDRAAANLIAKFDINATEAQKISTILAAATDALEANTGKQLNLAEPLAIVAGSKAIADLDENSFNEIIDALSDVLPENAQDRLRKVVEDSLLEAAKTFEGIPEQVQRNVDAQIKEFSKGLDAEAPTARLGFLDALPGGARDVAAAGLDRVIANATDSNRALKEALVAIANAQNVEENVALVQDIRRRVAADKATVGTISGEGRGSLGAEDIDFRLKLAKELADKQRLAAEESSKFTAALVLAKNKLTEVAGIDLAQMAEDEARSRRSARAERQMETFEFLGDQIAFGLEDTARAFGSEVDPLKQELREFIKKFENEVIKLEQATIQAVTPQREMATALRKFAEKQLQFSRTAQELDLTDFQRGLITQLNTLGGSEKRIGRSGDQLSKGFGAPALQQELNDLLKGKDIAGKGPLDEDEKKARDARIQDLRDQLAEYEKAADVTFGELRGRFVDALIKGLADIRAARVTDQRQARDILGERLKAAGPIPEEALNLEQRQKTLNQVIEFGVGVIQRDIKVRQDEVALIRAKAAELKQQLSDQAREIAVSKQRAQITLISARAAAQELTGIRKIVAERQIAARQYSIESKALKDQLKGIQEQIMMREKILEVNEKDKAAIDELDTLRQQSTDLSLKLEAALEQERSNNIRSVLAAAREASQESSRIADRQRTEIALRSSIAASLTEGGGALAEFNAKLQENAATFSRTQAELSAERIIAINTIEDEGEREAQLQKIRDRVTTATLEAADAEAQIIAERREAVKQLSQELIQNQQQQVEAQKAVIDATAAVGEAFEGYMQAVDGAIMATTQYNLNLALVETQNQKLLGGFTGLREQLGSVQDVFRDAESAARQLGASEKTLVQLRRQSINQQLQLFNQLLSEQSSLARQFFTSSTQDQADLFQGINEAQGIAELLGGSFDAFKAKGEGAINDLGAQLLSLPQETRQRVIQALETLQKVGGSVGDFTASELLTAIETASLGVSGEGLEVDPLFQVQERIAQLSEEQARLATEGLISANEGVEVAKEQLEQAEAAKDLAEIQLERIQEEGTKLRGQMSELRGSLNTTLLRQDQTNRTGFDAVTAAVNRVQQAVKDNNALRNNPEMIASLMQNLGAVGINTGLPPVTRQTPQSKGLRMAQDQRRSGSNAALQNQFFGQSGPGVIIPSEASNNVPAPRSNIADSSTTQRTNEILDRVLVQLQDLNTTSNNSDATLTEIRDGQETGGTGTAAAAVAQSAIEFIVNVQGEQRITVTGFAEGVSQVATALAETFGGFATEAEAEAAARAILEPIIQELINRGILQRNQVTF